MQKSRFWSAESMEFGARAACSWPDRNIAEFLGISGKNWNCELCTFILYFWKMAFTNMSHLRYNIFYTSDNKHEGSVNMQNYCFEKK